MEIKLFEIRDRATFIPAMAVLVYNDPDARSEREQYLLGREGYARSRRGESCCGMVLTHLGSGQGHSDSRDWERGGARTMAEAYRYIETCWDELESGAVIDVEFILGEKPEPKQSEQDGLNV